MLNCTESLDRLSHPIGAYFCKMHRSVARMPHDRQLAVLAGFWMHSWMTHPNETVELMGAAIWKGLSRGTRNDREC